VVTTGRRSSPGFAHHRVRETAYDLRRPADLAGVDRVEAAIICPWVSPGEAEPTWLADLTNRLAQLGTEKILYFSTIWVYGEQPVGMLNEDSPTNPSNDYAIGHLANERTLAGLCQSAGLDVTVLRMSNLVGSDPFHRHRARPSFAHDMMAMALHDQRILLRSAPSTPRNFLARARLHHDIDAIAARPFQPARFELFNMTGDKMATVGQFAHQIAAAATGYHGHPVPIEHPEDPMVECTFRFDSQRIRRVAGPCPNDVDGEIPAILADVTSMLDPVQ